MILDLSTQEIVDPVSLQRFVQLEDSSEDPFHRILQTIRNSQRDHVRLFHKEMPFSRQLKKYLLHICRQILEDRSVLNVATVQPQCTFLHCPLTKFKNN